MNDRKEKQEIRLLAHVHKSRYDQKYYEADIRPVRMEDGHVRNISESMLDPSALADLQIHARGLVGDGKHPYAWRVDYQQPYVVDLARAETMASTLKSIKRALHRMETNEGEPESFATYAIRVARALGVTTFGYVTVQGPGYSHDDNEHRWMDARDFQYWMTHELDQLRNEGRDDD